MESSDIIMPLSHFPDQPVYNIKAVCKRTGISAATLRAWERRHGLPSPDRARQGYRLYSERDVAILFWLIHQVQSGVSIGQAAHQLAFLLSKGHDPEIRIPAVSAGGTGFEFSRPRSPDLIRQELIVALSNLDEQAADDLLAEASALYTPETMLISIIHEVIHTICGQDHQYEIPGAVKHFALNYARQYVMNMIQITPISRTRHGVVVTGFSDAHNEIDLLILSLLLRRRGWPVTYLGNDLDPRMLIPALTQPDTILVVFYTDDPRHAAKLAEVVLPSDPAGRTPRVVYCGHAVEIAPELEEKIPFRYLGADLRLIVRSIIDLL